MAIDNRYTFRDALALYTKNLVLYDTDQETIQSGDDGNLITVHTGLGDMSNITSLLTGMYAALGTPHGRKGAPAIYKKVALSGTWNVTSGNTQLLGTGGAANTELATDDIIFGNSKVLVVTSASTANLITLYKAPDFNATGITLYVLYPLANRVDDLETQITGSYPDGYNDVRLTFSTNQLTVKGATKVVGINVNLSSTITVSGIVAGWRYVVSTSAGVITAETIPVAEIIDDTTEYTPSPVFNTTYNGYYSTVNTTKRIIGILYYDATNITEVINYGNGTRKNDSIWETNDVGINATAAGTRLQFTGTWDKQRGDLITCVDNGAAISYNDTEGFRITFNKDCNADIGIVLTMSSGSINMHKNAALYKSYILNAPTGDAGTFITIPIVAAKNDYFTFVNNVNCLGATISSMTIRAREY